MGFLPNIDYNIEQDNENELQYIDQQQDSYDNMSQEEMAQAQEQYLNKAASKTAKKKKPPILFIILIILLLATIYLYFPTIKSYIKNPFAKSSDSKELESIENTQELGEDFYEKAKEKEENLDKPDPAIAKKEEQPLKELADEPKQGNIQEGSKEDDGKSVSSQNEKTTEIKVYDENSLTQEKKQPPKTKAQLLADGEIGYTRLDPFVPYLTNISSGVPKNSLYDIAPPPKEISTLDPNIEELMKITVSGIMYDNLRPSAILNIKGSDQLVRVGDRLKDFAVVGISRTQVAVKYGTNIYKARVGQTLGLDGVNFREEANLQHKFGGSYSNPKKKTIQINQDSFDY